MYIKAKRWRETKYKAKAAFRNPRGELRDRDDLRKQQETRRKKLISLLRVHLVTYVIAGSILSLVPILISLESHYKTWKTMENKQRKL